MKKLTITPPEGYEVDTKNSTFEKIVFKKKGLTYNEVARELFGDKRGYYISSCGDIIACFPYLTMECNQGINHSTSKEQLQCILAKNKLANVARYLNGDWALSYKDSYWILAYSHEKSIIVAAPRQLRNDLGEIAFKSRELAEQAIQILGEEEVKLALKPLY